MDATPAAKSPKSEKICAAFLKFTQTRLEYFSCLQKSGADDSRLLKRSSECASSITSMLSGIAGLDATVATQFLNDVNESAFSPEHKTLCIEAMESKVYLAVAPIAAAPADDSAKQSILNVAEYIQEGQGDACNLHATDDVYARLRAIACILRKVGANHLDEETKARATACAFFDYSDQDLFVNLTGNNGYYLLTKFRQYYASTPVYAAGRQPHVYPKFATFEQDHPLLFATGGFQPGKDVPAFSKDLQSKLMAYGERIPKRCSNNDVTTPTYSRPQGNRAKMPRLLQNIGSAEGLESLPGFTWCNNVGANPVTPLKSAPSSDFGGFSSQMRALGGFMRALPSPQQKPIADGAGTNLGLQPPEETQLLAHEGAQRAPLTQ